ncbi:MAG TPA: rRNA maturation RNase YbeY [Ktedonobacterales bacterium]|jgi:probable rRNA maturation factor
MFDADEAGFPAQQTEEAEEVGWAELTLFIDDEAGDEARRLNQPLLAHVAHTVLELAGIRRPVELNLLVRGDEGLRELNRVYRGKDTATDVLSFPALDEPLVTAPTDELWQDLSQPEVRFITAPGLPLQLGDVAISYPTAIRQAAEAGHSPLHEFAFLLAHGILHLIGFDDQTEAGYHRMVDLQNATLGQIGIA